nr:hypothetical protein Iba_scaffold36015CG0010 [Ipomoea batatas]
MPMKRSEGLWHLLRPLRSQFSDPDASSGEASSSELPVLTSFPFLRLLLLIFSSFNCLLNLLISSWRSFFVFEEELSSSFLILNLLLEACTVLICPIHVELLLLYEGRLIRERRRPFLSLRWDFSSQISQRTKVAGCEQTCRAMAPCPDVDVMLAPEASIFSWSFYLLVVLPLMAASLLYIAHINVGPP